MSKDIHSFIHKSNSWREFHELLKNESDFIKGKAFEHFCICYLSTNIFSRDLLKNVWHESNCPDEIYIDKLGLLRPEIGVDIICEDLNNRFWAVQSKYRSNESENLPYSEVSTFFHVVSRPKTRKLLSNKLIMTSTYELSDRIGEVDDDFNCLNYSSFDELGKSDFDDFRDYLNNKFIPKNNNLRNPRPHQNHAIRAICKDFKSNSRLQVIMACGTGKTLVALWVKEALKYKQVLVLIPSLNLAAQIIKEWFTHKKYPFDALCICADKSVTKRDEDYDQWISSATEVNIPVNNDVNQIKIFLKNKSPKVVFCTYQSSNLVADAMLDKEIKDFDITFCDEAHRCAGADSKKYAIILDKNRIRSHKRLFLTATPKATDDELNTEAIKKERIIHSMDDKSKFGKRSYVLTFHDALTKFKKPLLCNYRIVICDIQKSEYKTYEKIIKRKFSSIENVKQIDAGTLATHIALLKSIKKFNLKRIITFHNKCERAKNFSDTLPKVYEWHEKDKSKEAIICEYIDGEMSTFKRKEKLKILKSKTSNKTIVFSNARCLQEGVDINNLDGIAFVDPRQSFIEIIQAIGRVMRLSEETGKKYGTILIPVFLDNEKDINQKINTSNFEQVWRIGKALSEHDAYLSEKLKELRISLGRRKAISKGNKGLIIDKIILPERMQNQFAEDIHLLLAKKLTDDWYEKYGQLLAYVDRNGHAKVPQNDKNLGIWVNTQRRSYRNGSLSKTKRKYLNKLKEKGWSWNIFADNSKEYLEFIEEYLKKNGHLIIRASEKNYYNAANNLRKLYKQNPISAVHISVFNRLNKLNKYWMWNPKIDKSLEKIMFLNEWCYENDSANPERNTIHNGSPKTYNHTNKNSSFDLGSKAEEYRSKFRYMRFDNDPHYTNEFKKDTKNKRRLDEKEIKALNDNEFWYWEKFEGYLRVYRKCIEKGIKIKATTKVDFDAKELRNIGLWVSRMRNKAIRKGREDNKGKLKTHEIISLESLPNWTYEPDHDSFMKGIDEFRKYTKNKENKDIFQSVITESGFKLGRWVSDVRRRYNNQTNITENKIYPKFYKKLLDTYQFLWVGNDLRGNNIKLKNM